MKYRSIDRLSDFEFHDSEWYLLNDPVQDYDIKKEKHWRRNHANSSGFKAFVQ